MLAQGVNAPTGAASVIADGTRRTEEAAHLPDSTQSAGAHHPPRRQERSVAFSEQSSSNSRSPAATCATRDGANARRGTTCSARSCSGTRSSESASGRTGSKTHSSWCSFPSTDATHRRRDVRTLRRDPVANDARCRPDRMVRGRCGPRPHSLPRRSRSGRHHDDRRFLDPAGTAALADARQHELGLDTAGDSLPVTTRPTPPVLFEAPVTGETREDGARGAAKRALDIAGSAALLIAFSPVFLFVSALVKLTSKGPVFYRQQRVGRGRPNVLDVQVPHHARERRPSDSSAIRGEFHPVQRVGRIAGRTSCSRSWTIRA